MRDWIRAAAALITGFALFPTAGVLARDPPTVEAVIDGDPMYWLLPRGGIPAIFEPDYVSAADADEFLQPEEPVFGLVIEGEARAYSLWHLDHHEVVNDSAGNTDFAVTW